MYRAGSRPPRPSPRAHQACIWKKKTTYPPTPQKKTKKGRKQKVSKQTWTALILDLIRACYLPLPNVPNLQTHTHRILLGTMLKNKAGGACCVITCMSWNCFSTSYTMQLLSYDPVAKRVSQSDHAAHMTGWRWWRSTRSGCCRLGTAASSTRPWPSPRGRGASWEVTSSVPREAPARTRRASAVPVVPCVVLWLLRVRVGICAADHTQTSASQPEKKIN